MSVCLSKNHVNFLKWIMTTEHINYPLCLPFYLAWPDKTAPGFQPKCMNKTHARYTGGNEMSCHWKRNFTIKTTISSYFSLWRDNIENNMWKECQLCRNATKKKNILKHTSIPAWPGTGSSLGISPFCLLAATCHHFIATLPYVYITKCLLT